MAYRNLDPAHTPHRPTAIFRWGIWEPLVGKRKRTPNGDPAPSVTPDLARVHEASTRTRLTWLGHAGFLVSFGDRHFLIDPLLSRRVGAVYRNFLPPPLEPGDWPPIDAVLVTHNHYDHLDRIALNAVPRDVPAIVPQGLGRWFRRWSPRPVEELAWWQAIDIRGVEISMVPARHWSRRHVFDVNRSHWGGFVLSVRGTSLYHAGDSAWFDGFREIGRRFPGLDIAMLPIGAYEPGWFMEHHHLNPEQACDAFLATGAQRFVPMHWGSIRLTDETLAEPIERVRAWWARNTPQDGRRLSDLAVGQTLVIESRQPSLVPSSPPPV
ncbi:MAG: MBL fold metallo-hydrolase [Acidobacteriota bacterium]|nr:MBL fold metallo-hydrolase [Acidobacteriota bacterium]